MTVSRRYFLAGAALPLLCPRTASAAADQSQAMLALLPDHAAATKLGASWVQQEHKQPGAVLQSLHDRLGGGDIGKLRDAIAEDFRNSAIVKIEGWQVARTQAELCALAYFATRGSL
jgi:hypothetical protein